MYALFRNTVTALALVGLTACGSSSTEEEIISPEPETPPPATKTIVEGPISSDGTVEINGVTYNTSNATFTKNGQAGEISDLREGQIVQLEGTTSSSQAKTSNKSSNNIDVSNIIYNANLIGAIESIDLDRSEIVVFGHTISFSSDAASSFVNTSLLNQFSLGDIVEISGTKVTTNHIEASYIEKQTDVEAMTILGHVDQLDTDAQTFYISDVLVDYSEATVVDETIGALEDGALVIVGTTNSTEESFNAEFVTVLYDPYTDAENGAVSLRGVVTRYESTEDFDINTIPASVSDSIEYVNGTAEDLALGKIVTVTGTLNEDGSLTLDEIEYFLTPNTGLSGTVDAISDTSITLLGVEASIDATITEILEFDGTNIAPIELSSIVAGDYVHVVAVYSDAGTTAYQIVKTEALEDSAVFGLAENTDESTITIAGISITTSETTIYSSTEQGILTLEEFLAISNDNHVLAVGDWSDSTLNTKFAQVIEGFNTDFTWEDDAIEEGGGNGGGSDGGDGGTDGGNGDGGTGGDDDGEPDPTTIIEYDYANFSQVNSTSAFETTITYGETYSVSVEIDEDAVDFLDVTSEENALNLEISVPDGVSANIETLKATITLPSITAITATEASNVTVDGFTETEIALTASGAGHIVLNNTTADDVSVTLSEAARISSDEGAAITTLTGTINDAASLDLDNTAPITSVTLDLYTASNATVNIAVEGSLSGSVNDVSSLSYYGTEVTVEVTVAEFASLNNLGDTVE